MYRFSVYTFLIFFRISYHGDKVKYRKLGPPTVAENIDSPAKVVSGDLAATGDNGLSATGVDCPAATSSDGPAATSIYVPAAVGIDVTPAGDIHKDLNSMFPYDMTGFESRFSTVLFFIIHTKYCCLEECKNIAKLRSFVV